MLLVVEKVSKAEQVMLLFNTQTLVTGTWEITIKIKNNQMLSIGM